MEKLTAREMQEVRGAGGLCDFWFALCEAFLFWKDCMMEAPIEVLLDCDVA